MRRRDTDIAAATQAYEQWAATQTDLIAADVRTKHERMSESPFVFLRATFYRWIEQWVTICGSIAEAPAVTAVGDLHVENFGTWRDHEARLVWGINDLDEAASLPYTQDLVRLATSAWLATKSGALSVPMRAIASEIVEGYAASLENGGQPIVLAERHRWLRRAAWGDSRAPVAFWDRIRKAKKKATKPPRAVIEQALPARRMPYEVFRRVAGVGSLGRPRFLAVAIWKGAMIAREVKARVPSAAIWAGVGGSRTDAVERLLQRSVRAQDPYYKVTSSWITRRLAPDCSKVELGDLARKRREGRLLRAMGWEAANLHLASARGGVLRRHLRGLPNGWLRSAAADMADVTLADWRAWTNSSGAAGGSGRRRSPS